MQLRCQVTPEPCFSFRRVATAHRQDQDPTSLFSLFKSRTQFGIRPRATFDRSANCLYCSVDAYCALCARAATRMCCRSDANALEYNVDRGYLAVVVLDQLTCDWKVVMVLAILEVSLSDSIHEPKPNSVPLHRHLILRTYLLSPFSSWREEIRS